MSFASEHSVKSDDTMIDVSILYKALVVVLLLQSVRACMLRTPTSNTLYIGSAFHSTMQLLTQLQQQQQQQQLEREILDNNIVLLLLHHLDSLLLYANMLMMQCAKYIKYISPDMN